LLAVHVSPRNWKVVHPRGFRPLGHGDALVLYGTGSYFSPIFLIGAESLVSGRRVKGRVATACDAVDALDAVAATGTLTSRGRRSHPGSSVGAADEPDPIRGYSLVARHAVPGRPPRPQPGASLAGRSGAVLSKYGPIRQCHDLFDNRPVRQPTCSTVLSDHGMLWYHCGALVPTTLGYGNGLFPAVSVERFVGRRAEQSQRSWCRRCDWPCHRCS
jgi:hypothetical protein